VLFCEETLYVLVDFLVTILTRKCEKDLQLIWPLKYDTVSETDLLELILKFLNCSGHNIGLSPVLKITLHCFACFNFLL